MKDDFKEDIVKIGRVRLVDFPGGLHPSMVRKISERSEFLAKQVDDIDTEIGFTYPPIEILPSCILPPWGEHIIFALKSFRRFDEVGYMVVKLSAPTILAFKGEQLDAILAHEFLHYVWHTISFMSATTEVDGVLVSNTIDEHPDYMKSPETYENIDSKERAVDSDWLPARLVTLSRKLSGPKKDQFITSSMLDVFDKWLRKGYPTQKMDSDYRYQGHLVMDSAVIGRARQLGLLKP